MRHGGDRDFLKVVGGKEVVCLGHELFEEGPCLPGDAAQGLHLGHRQRGDGAGGGGLADARGDGGGQGPDQREGQQDRPDGGVDPEGESNRAKAQCDPARHIAEPTRQAVATCGAGFGCCHPFQQVTV